jgi:hypothetical protein
MITTNPRTHTLLLTHDRSIQITESQYKSIKAMQKLYKWTDPLEIRDIDSWKILHDGLMKDIVGFREIERGDSSGMQWVCDFATRHGLKDPCNCAVKYNMPPIVFRFKLNELYPWKYASTITEEEKSKILTAIRK